MKEYIRWLLRIFFYFIYFLLIFFFKTKYKKKKSKLTNYNSDEIGLLLKSIFMKKKNVKIWQIQFYKREIFRMSNHSIFHRFPSSWENQDTS